MIAILYLPDYIWHGYRAFFYRTRVQCHARPGCSEESPAKCNHLEYQCFSFCVHYRPCNRRISDCRTGKYGYDDRGRPARVYFLYYSYSAETQTSLNERGEKKTWDSVKEGLYFVFKTKELLAAVSLDLFAVLFGGAVALIPVYARDILKVGARGFGFLNAASDMGSVCIVIILNFFPNQKKTG